MIRTISTIIILVCLIGGTIQSQDIHFTNYTTAPQNLNPALTGSFHGTYKVGGIIRSQFDGFGDFKTQGLFAEMNINAGIKEHHWTSVGIFMDGDKAGDAEFGSTQMGINAAYHLALDDDYRNVFTLGAQMSNISRGKINNGAVKSQEPEDFTNRTGSTQDFSFGFQYATRFNKTTQFNIGTSFYHFLFGANRQDKAYQVPFRTSAHASLDMRVNKKVSFRPQVYYSRTKAASNLAIQALGTYWLKDQAFDLGLGYRVGDAIQFLTGYHIKGWVITGSFDMTVSGAASNTTGAFELGAYKIFNRNPKVKFKNIDLCPRL